MLLQEKVERQTEKRPLLSPRAPWWQVAQLSENSLVPDLPASRFWLVLHLRPTTPQRQAPGEPVSATSPSSCPATIALPRSSANERKPVKMTAGASKERSKSQVLRHAADPPQHGRGGLRIAGADKGHRTGMAEHLPVALGALDRGRRTFALNASPAMRPSSVRSIGMAMNWAISSIGPSLIFVASQRRFAGPGFTEINGICAARRQVVERGNHAHSGR